MAYKNIFNRFIISIVLITIYLFSLTNNFILLILITAIYLIIIFEIFNFFKSYVFIIIFYLIFSYVCFFIFFLFFFNINFFNLVVISIICFDSFSFFIGKILGKTYIFKKISPKKTLEGYLGGFFFTNLIFFCFYMIIDFNLQTNIIFVLVNLTILFSVIGDLIQSFFKRKNFIKDSSNYLPGHGGFFDRFDSFISSIILLLFYSLI